MNERIKKIAKDAGVLGDQGEDVLEGRFFITGNTKQMEKFAELLIRECAELVETQHTWITSVAASALIRKHFGVQE